LRPLNVVASKSRLTKTYGVSGSAVLRLAAG
jgi:hypothetical protein